MSAFIDAVRETETGGTLNSLIDPKLEVYRELDDARCKHEHFIRASKMLARKHEKWIRVYRQRKRIRQIHILEPELGCLFVGVRRWRLSLLASDDFRSTISTISGVWEDSCL